MCAAAMQQKAVRECECASMARPDLSMICDIKGGSATHAAAQELRLWTSQPLC